MRRLWLRIWFFYDFSGHDEWYGRSQEQGKYDPHQSLEIEESNVK
jgi:hypothetical protein